MAECQSQPADQGGCGIVSEPDPQEIEKEGLVNGMGWKCTYNVRPVCRRTSDWLLINILVRIANRMRTVFAFCFVLEIPSGKDKMLVHVSGLAENSTGFARFGK